MVRKKVLTVMLIVSFILLEVHTFAFADNDLKNVNNNTYIITEPYVYPVTPESPEWKSFTQTSQMIEACQVPEEIVDKMTTEALLDTVMSYPLIVNVVVQNTPQIGYDLLYDNNAAFRELITRKDMIATIDKEIFSKNACNYSNATDERVVSESAIKMIYMLASTRNSEYIAKVTQVTNNNVRTPRGSRVPHYENLTYSDHGTTSTNDLVADNQLSKTYPSATKISGLNPAYNCHSYAWHSTVMSNRYWIDSPSLYWSDGSYKVITTPKTSDKVIYLKGSSIIHSAIYFNAPTNLVQSKWGRAGVYRHQRGYGPYSGCTYKSYTRA